MWSLEFQKNHESETTPKDIDAWVFSKYQVNGLIYLLSQDISTMIEISELSLPKEVELDTTTIKIVQSYIDTALKENTDIPVFQMIHTEIWEKSLYLSLKRLWQILIDYPTLRKILQNPDFINKLKDNTREKILTPKWICDLVWVRFFAKNRKEILTDTTTGKAILLVYGTGKKGKYMRIYDPLSMFSPPLPPAEKIEEDAEESYKREHEYRKWREKEETPDPILDIIYSQYTEVI